MCADLALNIFVIAGFIGLFGSLGYALHNDSLNESLAKQACGYRALITRHTQGDGKYAVCAEPDNKATLVKYK